jgi:hypothetical protein
MEQPVPEGVNLQAVHGVRGVVVHTDVVCFGAGQHVVPLQDLVQQDPLDESAEPDPEDRAGHFEPAGVPTAPWLGRFAGSDRHGVSTSDGSERGQCSLPTRAHF